jgi:hypothetical protein
MYLCDSFRGVEFIIHTENMEEVGETRQWVMEGEKQECRGTERNEERGSSQKNKILRRQENRSRSAMARVLWRRQQTEQWGKKIYVEGKQNNPVLWVFFLI